MSRFTVIILSAYTVCMGLFQKQTISETAMLYTLGEHTTKLIVALGNTGKQYQKNRHNIGFLCADYLSKKWDKTFRKKNELLCELTETIVGSTKVILIKPTTMMNLSGNAVLAVQNYFKIANKDTLIIHDELDIHFGSVRLRNEGGSAGNNGVQSIIDRCGGDFNRIRIGIGPKHPDNIDSADFVLQDFSPKEQKHLNDLYKEVDSIISDFIHSNTPLGHDTRVFIV